MDEDARRRAARYVAQQLGRMRHDAAWLTATTGLSGDTVADFLDAKRWPREPTRRAIEDALGLERGQIKAVAQDWTPMEHEDPIDAAIEDSPKLTRAQKLRLRTVYAEMLEAVPDLLSGAM